MSGAWAASLGIWRPKPERQAVSAPQHPLVFTQQMPLKSTWNKENLLEAMLPPTSPIKKQNSRELNSLKQEWTETSAEREGGRGRKREGEGGRGGKEGLGLKCWNYKTRTQTP